MIRDALTLFSDEQAITADAASTNVLDLSVARNIGLGNPIPLVIQVTEAFNNLTTLTISVQQDDNSGFSSATILKQEVIALADLVAGKKSAIHFMPRNTERYIRLYYDVTGTDPTTGKISAFIPVDEQTNAANA